MALIFQQSFPWRENNRFTLLVDGDEIFSAMLGAIQDAQSQILLEMYLVESGVLMDRFIAALSDAAQRGVSVCLLFDDYGARGLSASDRQRLTRAGLQWVTYNPVRYRKLRRSLLRDHRKLLVVDGQYAFVGGMGLADVFDTESHPRRYWHDTALRIEGPVVADWHAVFCANWESCADQELPGVSPLAVFDDQAGQAGRVVGGRRFGTLSIHRSFLKRMRSAERYVWVMTAYFVPSHGMLRALRRAARRGVDVRLLLPGPMTDHPAVRYAGHRYYHSLLRAGVRIFEYQPRFLHAKILLCDDWVSLGSSNVDRWNLRWNLEANQEVNDSDFAARIRELFAVDLALSEECLADAWRLRARYRLMLEWFWGKVDESLEKISAYLKHRK